MRNQSRLGPGQRLLHIVIVATGWLLFGWAWLVVGRDLPDYGLLAWMILATLVISPAVTLYWVLHNLALFKRKGARRQVQQTTSDYAQDWAGRPVVADWNALRSAHLAVIAVVDGQKVYSNPILHGLDSKLSRLFGKG